MDTVRGGSAPFALDLFSANDERWQVRSTIGQTYGAVSALLAALALGGVAASVLLQARESRANREFAMRSAHTERQHLYCNLLFSFWETRYVLGELREEEIAGLTESMTNGAPGRRFWGATRAYRLQYVDSAKALHFRRIFDEAFQRQTSEEPAPPTM